MNNRQLDENNQKLDKNNCKLDENNRIEAARAKRIEAAKNFQEINEKEQDLLTEDFDSIFREIVLSAQGKAVLAGKSSLLAEQKKQLYTIYLKQDSNMEEKAALTAEKVKINGKTIGFCQINSMRPVIGYLKDHPNVKVCDFRIFKDKVFDISTLANHIANPTCPVVSIIISKSIPQSDRQLLEQARAARQNRFNIQYVS